MGIDIYTTWKGQTEEERKAQITGFSIISGHLGYLREAYHGEIFATPYLLKEAFDTDNGEAQIPASVLRHRLPFTKALARLRLEQTYPDTDKETKKAAIKSFDDFVKLCEEKERETGEPVTIRASY